MCTYSVTTTGFHVIRQLPVLSCIRLQYSIFVLANKTGSDVRMYSGGPQSRKCSFVGLFSRSGASQGSSAYSFVADSFLSGLRFILLETNQLENFCDFLKQGGNVDLTNECFTDQFVLKLVCSGSNISSSICWISS